MAVLEKTYKIKHENEKVSCGDTHTIVQQLNGFGYRR